jgi:hypothetical protein
VKPNGAPPRESEKHSRSNNLTGLALVSMAISITMSGGTLIPAIRAALEQSDSSIIAKLAAQGELLKIEVEGQTIELAPDALLIETTAAEGFACAEDAGYLVGLDTTLTDELVHEGLIRENSKNRTGCP